MSAAATAGAGAGAAAGAASTYTMETGHEEMILDYYGKRLATASSDRSVRIFDVQQDQHTLLAVLKGHDAPVWQVAWAHPKFGPLLASCSYDGRVCVWKEASNQWFKIYEYFNSNSSVNSVAWAPHTFGLMLAAGCADGTISILSRKDNNSWDQTTFLGHAGGVNAVSWGPEVKADALLASAASEFTFARRLVSGGCDNRVRIWRYDDATASWVDTESLPADALHGDWVRDVAWAPSIGLPANTIASASQDKTVMLWSEDASQGTWKRITTLTFEHPVWRVSWSVMGGILAVSEGEGKVSLWKEGADGEWKQISAEQAAVAQ